MTLRRWAVTVQLILLSFGVPTSVLAWDSDVHVTTIQLSNNLSLVPGLRNQDRKIIYPGDPKYACKHRLANVYIALLCGGDEPDKRRGARLFTHKADGEIRAKNALACAVYNLRGRGVSPVAAAAQFGHSIHYIQDMADPTNNIGRHKDKVRKDVTEALNDALHKMGRSDFPPFLANRLQQARTQMLAANNATEIINVAHGYAGMSANHLNRVLDNLERARRQGRNVLAAEYALKAAYYDLIAHIIAFQERWIALYAAGLRDWDNQPNYWREACMRHGAFTREGAQPPARDIRRCFSRDGRNELCRRSNCYIPERRTRICMSRDGRNTQCQRNGCNPVFRNRDGSTYRIPCYWDVKVVPAVPCYWK